MSKLNFGPLFEGTVEEQRRAVNAYSNGLHETCRDLTKTLVACIHEGDMDEARVALLEIEELRKAAYVLNDDPRLAALQKSLAASLEPVIDLLFAGLGLRRPPGTA